MHDRQFDPTRYEKEDREMLEKTEGDGINGPHSAEIDLSGVETSRTGVVHDPAHVPEFPAEFEFLGKGPEKETVLAEASRLVDGVRQSDYGHPSDNYSAMADMVNALLAHKFKDGEFVDALDCVRMLICMKLVRDSHKTKRDNWVDTAGYARVGEMIAAVDDLFDAAP